MLRFLTSLRTFLQFKTFTFSVQKTFNEGGGCRWISFYTPMKIDIFLSLQDLIPLAYFCARYIMWCNKRQTKEIRQLKEVLLQIIIIFTFWLGLKLSKCVELLFSLLTTIKNGMRFWHETKEHWGPHERENIHNDKISKTGRWFNGAIQPFIKN